MSFNAKVAKGIWTREEIVEKLVSVTPTLTAAKKILAMDSGKFMRLVNRVMSRKGPVKGRWRYKTFYDLNAGWKRGRFDRYGRLISEVGKRICGDKGGKFLICNLKKGHAGLCSFSGINFEGDKHRFQRHAADSAGVKSSRRRRKTRRKQPRTRASRLGTVRGRQLNPRRGS